jgi:hypothetical protein
MIKAIGRISMSIVLALYGAFAVSMLWSWFVVPFGIMALSLPHAIGIDLLVGGLVFKSRLRDITEEESLYLLRDNALVSTLCLAIGWAAHLWMVG